MKSKHILRVFLPVSAIALAFFHSSRAAEIEFRSEQIHPRSRIDAIVYLGKGVVVAGTRYPHPGYIHKSTDYGATWRAVGDITGPDFITCLCAGKDGVGYLLTGQNAHVWKTTDYGDTWEDLGQVSKASNSSFANAYGMTVTGKDTVLVADADDQGGHIYRSTDHGATWRDLGAVSRRPLYRLIEVGDGIIANGWAGHIYKSTDDGMTWRDMGKLIDSPLYAIEYIAPGIVLVGADSGNVLVSEDNGRTWKDRGIVGAFADDFAWIGKSNVLYSTYAPERRLYLSMDSGASWRILDKVNTGYSHDWLDHMIYISEDNAKVVVAGTHEGSILYSKVTSE